MTLRMLDSITVANLPAGADAYLGYVDGRWPTFAEVRARFPGRPVLSMAVFAAGDADGCDVEAGDLMPSQLGLWVKRQIFRGVRRPVIYASASAIPAAEDALTEAGLVRADVRLLSAHYGAGQHICGPATCAYPGVPACDGTQFTDAAPGLGGSLIDESILLDNFFTEASVPLTQADADLVARTLLNFDGVIPGPDGNKANPFWTPARVLADLGQQVRAIEAAVAAKAAPDPAAIISGVMAGLSPATLAEAIAASLGPAEAALVVAALAAKLGTP